MYLISILAFRLVDEMMQLSLLIVFYLVLSVVFNVVVGDTCYFKSQTILGVKTATPIVNTFPFVTIILSIIFLSEEFEYSFILGGGLIIGGVVLLSQETNQDEIISNGYASKEKLFGFILAFVSVIMYALGVFYTTLGSKDLNVNVANTVRQPSGVLILMIILIYQPRFTNSNNTQLSFRDQLSNLSEVSTADKIKIIIAGLLGTYFSALFLVLSTQELGAGKTAVLTSTGPLFALPLAIFWLKEKVGKLTILGTTMSLIGVWITII